MLDQLLGSSPVLAAVREELARLFARLAASPKRLPPVLIQGETGTGKGLVAHVIHKMGPRADAAFVDVNCAAIPDALLEAELFGYERGAFTDARQAKAGLLQVAHRGTMFLDEIGLMPDSLQVKLLKALEDRSVRRLGSTRAEPADAWVLAATSEDLAAAIRVRRFREDLYHRLAVVTVQLPPLRERGTDIQLLARHYLDRACSEACRRGGRRQILRAEQVAREVRPAELPLRGAHRSGRWASGRCRGCRRTSSPSSRRSTSEPRDVAIV